MISSSALFAARVRGLVVASACFFAFALPAGLAAQSVAFAGFSSPVGSGWTSPQAVAADAAGDLFVAEPGNVIELPAGGGGAPRFIGSGWNNPTSIAVDGPGNLYVVDTMGSFQTAIEFPVNGGYASSITIGGGPGLINGIVSPVAVTADRRGDLFIVDAGGGQALPDASPQIVVTNSIVGTISYPLAQFPAPGPTAIAVDSNLNLYYGDANGNIFSWTYNGAGIYETSQSPLLSTFSPIAGLAADAMGNVYFTYSGGGGVFEYSAQTFSRFTVAGGWNNPQGLAFDQAGNLYAADAGLSQVDMVRFNALNFGSVSICPSGVFCTSPSIETLSLNFSIASGVTVGSIGVFTLGATGQDFFEHSSDTTCAAGNYNSSTNCVETVEFAPGTAVGLRQGAVVFFSGAGNTGIILADLPIYGTATGPQFAFTPSVPAVQASSVTNPISVALDGSGNIYMVDATGVLWKQQGIGGTPVQFGSFGAGSSSKASGMAVDGAGNLFVSDQVADTVTEFPAGLTQPITVLSNAQGGLIYPQNLAVDGAGNLYVPDGVTGDVYEVQPGSTVPTVVASGLQFPEAVAVDGSGNLFIAEANLGGTGAVVKVPAGGGSPQTITGPWTTPWEVAVDAAGDLYVTDAACVCAYEVPAGGGAVVTVLNGLYIFPAIALDGTGDIFYGAANLMELQRAQPPALTFASTALGSTSTDSPQTITVQNIGNQQAAIQSAVFPTDFPEAAGDATACIAGNLALGASCDLSIDFTPQSAGSLAEAVTLNYNGPGFAGASQSVSVSGTGTQQAPLVLWAPPAPITYGTPLSATQLDAQANVPGTFVYTPAIGSVLGVGTETLSVTFTPSSAAYTPATITVSLTVNQATPVITWPQPATITFGTALSATQLDATASTPGKFVYTPAAGTIPSAGGTLLSVTFTPTDQVDYATATGTAVILVNPAKPTVTWATPAPIAYGTKLSATQLDAKSNVQGTFTYSPAAGTSLGVGAQTLSVFFTPKDATDYLPVQTTAMLTVNPATPVITWPTPAPITHGTPLSATQLDATANVPGAFVYNPPAGKVLDAGLRTITTTFTPTDAVDYATTTASVQILVNKKTPVIAWAAPAAITYGTALSPTQLNATTTTPGTFAYTPAAGTVLTVGVHTLSVTFTPTPTVPEDYTTATATVTITVTQAAPVLTWPAPGPITYLDPLTATQLDATANTPGVFVYTPPLGTVLSGGTQTLSVSFTPTDAVDYTSAATTVQLTVERKKPFITWPAPASIVYGTPLSKTQLDASSRIAGAFVYTPAVGTVLGVGSHTLSVTLTPTLKVDYAPVTATVTLVVTKATPTITWPAPAPITYLTPLSAAQLDATANTPGSFVYSPSLGTILTAGVQTLAVNFAPTDTVDYLPIRVTVMMTVEKKVPPLTWATPAPITYGTPLGVAQLSASARIPGTFVYSPVAGTKLPAGSHTLSATFTPGDMTNYAPATATVTLVVKQAIPVLAWAEPAAITYGTPLSTKQLDATASVPGKFAYTPAAGTMLKAGRYTLSATFTPTDKIDYSSPKASVTLTVNKATPTITWPTPAPITYLTPLGAAQLDATASVPGVLTYTPSAGTVLNAGAQKITVLLAPTDATDYEVVTASVQLTVNKKTPPLTWDTPAPITYGTPLGGSQLKATTPAAGTFVYTPAAGTILAAGTQTLSVLFTPTNATDYTTATASVTLTVKKATPVLKLTTSATSVALGKPVTLTATLTGNPASRPSGSVRILDGATVLLNGHPNTDGVVTLTTSTLAAGKHTITASYGGNADYAALTSTAVTVTIP